VPIGSVNWIEEGMLGTELTRVHRDGDVAGFAFTLRNQFFHGSHPLGWIRRLAVDVDGRTMAPESVRFVLREQSIPSPLIPQIADIWWQPTEVATIVVHQPGGLAPGQHIVGCELAMSTFFFTHVIDRWDVYPSSHLRLEASMPVGDGSVEGVA
jgi:hypothetical protein